jgi:hypothetical protein
VESFRPLAAGEILAALNRHQVDYVLIGGVAMQAHGHVRTTQDLDVIAAWTPQNTARLAAALRDLDARLRGVDADLLGIDVDDPEQLYAAGNLLMETRFGDFDVFAVEQTPGAPRSYEQLRDRAIPIQFRDLTVLVVHPEDMIRMKTAASSFRDRPDAKRRQDLDDIAVLERLRIEQQTRDAARLASAARPSQHAKRPGGEHDHPNQHQTPRPRPQNRKRPPRGR